MHRFKLSSLQILKPNYRAFHQTPSRHFSQQQTPIENAGTMASHLETRSVIRFRGPDTIKFLQGLLTNDVRRLANPSRENSNTSSFPTPNVPLVSPPPLYAALLTPQGRFLYDLFLYRTPRPEEKLDSSGLCLGSGKDEEFDLFADVDASVLDEFLNCFRKYRLRSKVEIENVAKEFCCWQRFGGSVSSKTQSSEDPKAADVGYGAAVDPVAMSASEGDNAGWRWYKDPRLDILGFRGVFPCNTTPPLVETDKETNEQNYLLWRLEKGVAEGSTEISKGEAIPLEYNLVGLNAISFDKGCYVGQEFIARTHHRGVIRKRLLPLKFVNGNGKEIEQKVAPGSEVIETSSGKKVGHVNTALGSRGMGLLRLEQAVRGSGTLGIKGMDDVKIEVIRPEWWPPEWFPEHHPQNAAA